MINQRPTSFGRRTSKSTEQASALLAELEPRRDPETVPAERPLSMQRFDQMMSLTMAVSLIQLLLTLPLMRDVVDRSPVLAQMGMSFQVIFAQLVGSFLFMLFLWFITSRLRSRIGCWILTVSACWTLIGNLVQVLAPQPGAIEVSTFVRAVSILATLMGVIAAAFLHTPESKVWLAGKRQR